MHQIKGNIVDIINRKIFPGILYISDNKITKIEATQNSYHNYIIPGFVDAHIHIESSMLPPVEFGRIAINHGTVGVLCDPHEIANVMGIPGIEYMIESGKKSPLKFNYAAPSCVPATPYDSNGAVIGPPELNDLLRKPEIKALAEFMNYPGVINKDATVLEKLAIAHKHNKPIDGHAPGLSGEELKTYVKAGISTDHESTLLEEALEKISQGMMIQIREGSACKDFNALHSLIKTHPGSCMFCSDDLHPDDLINGHINLLVKKSILLDYDLFDILRIASLNTIKHYNLSIGLLQKNDPADFLIIDNLKDFNIIETWIDGKKVSHDGQSDIEFTESKIVNNFETLPKSIDDFKIPAKTGQIKVISARDKAVTTEMIVTDPTIKNGLVVSDTDRDILKIAVINRYQNAKPGLGLIKGIGLKTGAIASSVSHDSHNIIAVGVDDESICKAVNSIVSQKGGISCVNNQQTYILPLPIAGIISNLSCEMTSKKYNEMNKHVSMMGSPLNAPFMTLSFMSLLVIPSLKINDFGLFDGIDFGFVDIWTQEDI